MKMGILGSGTVAQTIGTKLLEKGHEVMLGTRELNKLNDWLSKVGKQASVGTFAETAAFAEMIFNCTAGTGSIEALSAAGGRNLIGKILVDISNPLDFSKGMPPTLTICNDDSLAEEIQRTFPDAKVVKTLNTMTAAVMVNPGILSEESAVFVSGNDADAKASVTELLKNDFGWKSVIDLGDISTARGTEMVLALWIRLMGALQTPLFNYKIVK